MYFELEGEVGKRQNLEISIFSMAEGPERRFNRFQMPLPEVAGARALNEDKSHNLLLIRG